MGIDGIFSHTNTGMDFFRLHTIPIPEYWYGYWYCYICSDGSGYKCIMTEDCGQKFQGAHSNTTARNHALSKKHKAMMLKILSFHNWTDDR
jgi:hypothetical protein